MNQLYQYIEKNLSNEDIQVEVLAKELGMSYSQLYRKIKALTNFTITGFIRDYRLQKAMKMLQIAKHNVTEVAYLTGFSNRRYFHKAFVEKYNCLYRKGYFIILHMHM